MAIMNSLMYQFTLAKTSLNNDLDFAPTEGASSSDELVECQNTSETTKRNASLGTCNENYSIFCANTTDQVEFPGDEETGGVKCLKFTCQSDSRLEAEMAEAGQMKTCAGTSLIKASPIHQCARMETGQGNESHSASASLNNLNPNHIDESAEAGRSNVTDSLVNVTPSEVMKKLLDNIFDHPCGKCKSERVSHIQDNVWICGSCGEIWGYDDGTDVDELVKEMLQFFPCPYCENANMYEISFMCIDGTLLFGCHVCEYGYKPQGDAKNTQKQSARNDRKLTFDGLKNAEKEKSWLDNEKVMQGWAMIKDTVGGSLYRVLSDGMKLLGNAASTNSDPTKEFSNLVAKEAKSVCIPVFKALGDMAGALVFQNSTAGNIGGNLGVLVGQAVQAYISGSGQSMK